MPQLPKTTQFQVKQTMTGYEKTFVLSMNTAASKLAVFQRLKINMFGSISLFGLDNSLTLVPLQPSKPRGPTGPSSPSRP